MTIHWDIVFVDKETREVKILDMAIPGDTQVKQKELDKMRNAMETME